MKRLDLIKLINEKPYVINNLNKGMHGVVMNETSYGIAVLFFNPHNIGEYAIVNVKRQDIVLEKEKLPPEIQEEMLSRLDNIMSRARDYIAPIAINNYDTVELIVEAERYAKHGIHKGDIGCVIDNDAVGNYIEVDFSGVDEDGNYYGGCIGVDIKDLKVIE